MSRSHLAKEERVMLPFTANPGSLSPETLELDPCKEAVSGAGEHGRQ